MSIVPSAKGIIPVKSWQQYSKDRAAEYAKILGIFTASAFPDIVCGFVPLYTVLHYEFASSQDILRYRAIGAQYLAHQAGGNFSLRVDCMLKGAMSLIYLSMLQGLYMYGGKSEENSIDPTQIESFTMQPATVIEDKEKVELLSDNVEKVPTTDLGWIKHNKHETFTVLTKENVLFDMYIESIIYYQNMEGDKDTIFVSLLFRKFTPNPMLDSSKLYTLREKEASKLNNAKKELLLSKDTNIVADYKNLPVQITKDLTSRYNFYRQQYPYESPYIDVLFSQLHTTAMRTISLSRSRLETYKSRSMRDYGVIGNAFKLRKNPVKPDKKIVDNTTPIMNTNKETYSAIHCKSISIITPLDLDKMEIIVPQGTSISKNLSETFTSVNNTFAYKVYSADGTTYNFIIYDNTRQKIYSNIPAQIGQYYLFNINGLNYLYILRHNVEYQFYRYYGSVT